MRFYIAENFVNEHDTKVLSEKLQQEFRDLSIVKSDVSIGRGASMEAIAHEIYVHVLSAGNNPAVQLLKALSAISGAWAGAKLLVKKIRPLFNVIRDGKNELVYDADALMAIALTEIEEREVALEPLTAEFVQHVDTAGGKWFVDFATIDFEEGKYVYRHEQDEEIFEQESALDITLLVGRIAMSDRSLRLIAINRSGACVAYNKI